MPRRQLRHGRDRCGTYQVNVKFYLWQRVDEGVHGFHEQQSNRFLVVCYQT